jgi:hypothetical protein
MIYGHVLATNSLAHPAMAARDAVVAADALTAELDRRTPPLIPGSG